MGAVKFTKAEFIALHRWTKKELAAFLRFHGKENGEEVCKDRLDTLPAEFEGRESEAWDEFGEQLLAIADVLDPP